MSETLYHAERIFQRTVIAVSTGVFTGITLWAIALALWTQPTPSAPTPIAAPDLTPDEPVAEQVAPTTLPLISLDEIEYLQWCLAAAESDVSYEILAPDSELTREDIRFAREEMSYTQRFRAYEQLEDMKDEAPTMGFDLSPTNSTI